MINYFDIYGQSSEALRRVTPEHVRALLSPSVQPETRLAATLLAKGLPASPGVGSGTACADVDAALDAADEDEDVVLVRTSTSGRSPSLRQSTSSARQAC
jgi:pyruvate,orthophosphate dikinase